MIRNDVDADMFDDDEEHTGLDMDPILTTNPSLSMFTSEAGNKRGAFRDGLMAPMYVLTTHAHTHTNAHTHTHTHKRTHITNRATRTPTPTPT